MERTIENCSSLFNDYFSCLCSIPVLFFLKKNANPCVKAPIDMPARNELGSQPIHWAASSGHVPVVDLLLEAGAQSLGSNIYKKSKTYFFEF